MVEFARRKVDGWASGQVVNMADELAQLILAITAKTLFGADLAGKMSGIREAMAVIQEKTIREMSQALTLPVSQKRDAFAADET